MFSIDLPDWVDFNDAVFDFFLIVCLLVSSGSVLLIFILNGDLYRLLTFLLTISGSTRLYAFLDCILFFPMAGVYSLVKLLMDEKSEKG